MQRRRAKQQQPPEPAPPPLPAPQPKPSTVPEDTGKPVTVTPRGSKPGNRPDKCAELEPPSRWPGEKARTRKARKGGSGGNAFSRG